MKIGITGGRFRGRKLSGIPESGELRPTTGRVREAFFSIIAFEERGAFLDLFAGSGIMGFEALSRGFVSSDFVEERRQTCLSIKKNLDLLSEPGHVYCEKVSSFLRRRSGVYACVYADPPYHSNNWDWLDLLAPLVRLGGIFALETAADEDEPRVAGFTCEFLRVYGDTKITLFRRSQHVTE